MVNGILPDTMAKVFDQTQIMKEPQLPSEGDRFDSVFLVGNVSSPDLSATKFFTWIPVHLNPTKKQAYERPKILRV